MAHLSCFPKLIAGDIFCQVDSGEYHLLLKAFCLRIVIFLK